RNPEQTRTILLSRMFSTIWLNTDPFLADRARDPDAGSDHRVAGETALSDVTSNRIHNDKLAKWAGERTSVGVTRAELTIFQPFARKSLCLITSSLKKSASARVRRDWVRSDWITK